MNVARAAGPAIGGLVAPPPGAGATFALNCRLVPRRDVRAPPLAARAARAKAPAGGAVRRDARRHPLCAPQPSASDRARADRHVRATGERSVGAAPALRARRARSRRRAATESCSASSGSARWRRGLLLPRLRNRLGVERLATGAAFVFALSSSRWACFRRSRPSAVGPVRRRRDLARAALDAQRRRADGDSVLGARASARHPHARAVRRARRGQRGVGSDRRRRGRAAELRARSARDRARARGVLAARPRRGQPDPISRRRRAGRIPEIVRSFEPDRGPALVTVEYQIDPADAERFARAMRASARSACATARSAGVSGTTSRRPGGSSSRSSSSRGSSTCASTSASPPPTAPCRRSRPPSIAAASRRWFATSSTSASRRMG